MQKEINDLLGKLEKEFLSFVSHIKNVQEEYKGFPYSDKKFKELNLSDDEARAASDSTALVEAFNIVKNLLIRICNLIDQVSSLPTDSKHSFKKANTYLVNYYYSQYVYQIAAYLVKTVEEHLGDFSEKLEQSRSLNKDSRENLPKYYGTKEEKLPLRLSKSGIATVSAPLTAVYGRHVQNPSKQRYRSNYVREDSSSASSELTSDEDYETRRDGRFKRCIHSVRGVNENETDKIINRLVDSLNELATVVEDFLQHLVGVTCTKPTQTLAPAYKKKAFSEEVINLSKQVNRCCCSSCISSCETCSNIHKARQKVPRSKIDPLWPILNPEPPWMQMDPDRKKLCPACMRVWRKTEDIASETRYNRSKPADRRTSENDIQVTTVRESRTRSKTPPLFQGQNIPYTKEKPSQSSRKDAEKPRTSEDTHAKVLIEVDGSIQEKTVERISPGSHTKRVSTGKLGAHKPPDPGETREKRDEKALAAKRWFESEQINVSKRLNPSASDASKEKKEDSEGVRKMKNWTEAKMPKGKPPDQKDGGKDRAEKDKKPIFARDIKKAIVTKGHANDKFEGFCLLPITENQVSTDTKGGIFVNKEEDGNGKYPGFITFDVTEFSAIFRNKFSDLLKSDPGTVIEAEPDLLLDLLFDSLEKASNFYDEADDKEISDQLLSNIDQMKQKREDPKGKTSSEESRKVSEYNAMVSTEKDRKDFQGSQKNVENMISKEHQTGEKRPHACELCSGMIDSSSFEGKDPNHQRTKKNLLTSWEDSCFTCWNGRQRGLTIHQCHMSLPSGILEVRHMDDCGKICVCFLYWDLKKEPEDWRWFKSPFYDPTRVELEQEATPEAGPVLKVIFGPEGNMLKESLAETNLPIVTDFTHRKALGKTAKTSLEGTKCASSSFLLIKTNREQVELRYNSDSTPPSEYKKLVTKLGRLFDDIQNVGYGRGPPLVIKIRKKSAVNDAFDLLMAPSRIRLNYYRNLRVLIVEKQDSKLDPSSTNFIEEDQCDELFELFSNELFHRRLFEYQSEDSPCLYLNPEADVHSEWFTFAGAVLALAILHHKRLDIKLPSCLYKCLLDRPVNMHDLEEIDPMFYQHLMWLRENDLTTRTRRTTFSIREKSGNGTYETELIPNGRKIVVTEKNKFRYITLAVKWKLAERCLTQLKDFRRGFASVIEPGFLTIFSEKELQSMIREPPDDQIFLSESASGKNSGKKVARRETL